MIEVDKLKSWSPKQIQRLEKLLKDPKKQVAFWNSDEEGFPCNGGNSRTPVYPGRVQKIQGPLKICTKNGLHATSDPLLWVGQRVWIVALHEEIQRKDDKFASLKREILGEILPEEAWNDRLKARLARKDLAGADLSGADLTRADLTVADLSGADLSGANLSGADLTRADLTEACLTRANLTEAYLTGADLTGASLTGAYLTGADLTGADLIEASLTGAYYPSGQVPDGWERDKDGYLKGR